MKNSIVIKFGKYQLEITNISEDTIRQIVAMICVTIVIAILYLGLA